MVVVVAALAACGGTTDRTDEVVVVSADDDAGAPDASRSEASADAPETSPPVDAHDAATADAASSCIRRVTVGDDHACAVKANGELWCWGENSRAQLGRGYLHIGEGGAVDCGLHQPCIPYPGPATVVGPHIVSATASARYTCVIDDAGRASCWGEGPTWPEAGIFTETPASAPGLESGVVEISGSHMFACALKIDGSVWCWGWNYDGELGDGTRKWRHLPVRVAGIADVVEIAVGGSHGCARTSQGRLWCWGSNTYGQLGDGSTDGESCLVGPCRPSPVEVTPAGAGITQVTASAFSTCALRDDGTVWCWGRNMQGELGDGTTTSRATPGKVVGLGAGVVEVHGNARGTTSCARGAAGTVWCWGGDSEGATDDETTFVHPTPAEIAIGADARALAVGAVSACVIRDDSTVWCWGSNGYGELGDGSIGSPPCGCKPTPVEASLECP